MISESEVYKIKLTALTDYSERIFGGESWVHGFNVTPKVGGSGKTFTSKLLVNKMFNKIKSSRRYNSDFKCEIVTFELTEVSKSSSEV